MSIGEEVAGGDAAEGLMDVHASDLSGSSAIKVQPFVALNGCFLNNRASLIFISVF